MAGIWSALALIDPYLETARQCGFNRACDLLRTENPNEIEKRILTALRWAGQAASENAAKKQLQKNLNTDREQSFLFYAICLESLYCDRREKEVTAKLSERCASVMIKDTAYRKDAIKRICKLYDRRSDIVHQGGLTVTDQELQDIRNCACTSISEMLINPELIALKDEWFLKEAHRS